MRHLADSIVGGVVKRGISGGEKRRLSIATQLIQDPGLLQATAYIRTRYQIYNVIGSS